MTGGAESRKFSLVALTDAEDVQTDLICVLDALEQLAHAVDGADCQPGVVEPGGEAINAYFHLGVPCIRVRRGSCADKEAASLGGEMVATATILALN